MVPWILAWALLFGLWMLLVATMDPLEVLTGVVASAVAATGFEVVRRQRIAPLRPRPAWFLRAWSLPVRVAVEFGVVMTALWRGVILRRPVRGSFRAVPIEVGGRDARSIARRALITGGASLAPNRYVVDFDRHEGRVLVHELVARREEIVP
jgi:multisubunit Na+/H+ antiporter MnhE subunit